MFFFFCNDYRLDELKTFFKLANDRFSKTVNDDDYDGLVQTIDFLKQIRDRAQEINQTFEPIKVGKIIKFWIE